MTACSFLLFMNYTITIPDSYQLSTTLGRDADDSGLMIGLYQGGGMVGSTIMFILIKQNPNLWREGRRILLTCFICHLCGALLYLGIAAMAAEEDAAKPAIIPLWGGLLMARMVGGAGSGASFAFICMSIVHVTPPADRPNASMTLFAGSLLGMGLGPPVAAATGFVNPCGAFGPAGAAQVATAVALVLAVSWYPCLKLERSQEDGLFIDTHTDEAETVSRCRVVLGCLFLTTLRSFVVSGLEVGTVLLLETKYRWDLGLTSCCIASTFVAILPIKITHGALERLLSAQNWISLYSAVAMLCTVFMFTQICEAGMSVGTWEECGHLLILADVLVYPFAYMSDSLSIGIMMQHFLPRGSWLDLTHATFLQEFLGCGGRLFGPWFARWCINKGSQDIYAAVQLGSNLLFLSIFQIVVRPACLKTDHSMMLLPSCCPERALFAQQSGELIQEGLSPKSLTKGRKYTDSTTAGSSSSSSSGSSSSGSSSSTSSWYARSSNSSSSSSSSNSTSSCNIGSNSRWPGARALLAAARSENRVLAVGANAAEFADSLVSSGCSVFLIGEGRSVRNALEGRGGVWADGRLDGVLGKFPDDMPTTVGGPFDFAFFSSFGAPYSGSLSELEITVAGMLQHLRSGSRVILELASPWSAAFLAYWKNFAEQDGGIAFELPPEQGSFPGGGVDNTKTITLLTPPQAAAMLERVGFVKVSATPFRVIRSVDGAVKRFGTACCCGGASACNSNALSGVTLFETMVAVCGSKP
eukprot:TRINITY_DN7619_c0_g1_i1.p1 TRINITY_DN7619_c0_g1~~TRINITY_DN7619_c0_g1_i1.p1  ORF type:complete len:884 (+),score=132.68 TRINITY_DN7619_c0_g1_i1:389-2653(+)